MIHRVVVYLKANVIAHVQSTNGDEWPRMVQERDQNGVEIPLRRIELELEATQEEIDKGENGHPQHRRANALFNDELEYNAAADQVRYRADSGRDGKIEPRAAR